jgi:RimJ/RimL family protein N-acetyltransferase
VAASHHTNPCSLGRNGIEEGETRVLEEISLNEIGEYAPYFSDPQLDMVLASVAEGNTRAQIWRSIQPQNGITCLLWDKGNNVFYVSGETISKEATDDLAALIDTHIKGRAIKEGSSRFKVHALSPSLEQSIPQLFQGIQLYKTNKLIYVFRKQRVPAISTPALEDVRYALIDAGFLETERHQNLEYVQSEVDWMWSSRVKFRENGFGYAALLGDIIVCWCTAEYVSERKCGIGIETVEAYRNKGIATATTAHFVEYCLHHNITPCWECGSRNIGSIRVAEKVGFERIQEKVFWGGEFLSQDGTITPT